MGSRGDALTSTAATNAAIEPCCAPLQTASITDQEAAAAASLFKALGDPVRLRIVNLLASSGTAICVCDLTPQTGLSQPTVSFHLKKLMDAKLIEREKRGKWAYYSLRPGALEELAQILNPKGTP